MHRLDCTDMIDYNQGLLNTHSLSQSFFCIDKDDPTRGFEFDASKIFGPTFPAKACSINDLTNDDRMLHIRLILGSHLARYLRHELESQKGYTATVGIATNKTLSKLVGNVNKPKNQTTLMPPLVDGTEEGTIHQFMDVHDIGKVPGIGFKLAQKIRAFVLGRDARHEQGLVYGGTKENITVRDVRLHPHMSSEKLEEILGGPGSQKGIGGRVWDLLNGFDDVEVSKAKRVPSQISQEDSYMKYLHTFEQVRQQLFLLSERLIRRMRIDLMEDEEDEEEQTVNALGRRWLAHPRTLRLTTRPRPPVNADGTRSRTFNRISHSGPMPSFVLSVTESASALADKLVDTTLITMFRRLHPERNGWNLSLINIAAANMAETAADNKDSQGRDIGRMFRRQEVVLKDFKVSESEDTVSVSNEAQVEPPEHKGMPSGVHSGTPTNEASEDVWQHDDEADTEAEEGQLRTHRCGVCGIHLPFFAIDAHYRYHNLPEDSIC